LRAEIGAGEHPQRLRTATHPLIELGRRAKAEKFRVVRTDDTAGVKQSVDHLVELGHRAIAHIDGGNRPGAAERRHGYRRRMAHHGLEATIDIIAGDYTENLEVPTDISVVGFDDSPFARLS
jgi:DNA-binding LacI/PurR family transcriptional regulator